MGGFIAGLSASNGNPLEAALYGTISASFVVEQIGLPSLNKTTSFSFLSLTNQVNPTSSSCPPSQQESGLPSMQLQDNASMPSSMLPAFESGEYVETASGNEGSKNLHVVGREGGASELSKSLPERPAEEMWNNDVPSYRLEDLRNRLKRSEN